MVVKHRFTKTSCDFAPTFDQVYSVDRQSLVKIRSFTSYRSYFMLVNGQTGRVEPYLLLLGASTSVIVVVIVVFV